MLGAMHVPILEATRSFLQPHRDDLAAGGAVDMSCSYVKLFGQCIIPEEPLMQFQVVRTERGERCLEKATLARL